MHVRMHCCTHWSVYTTYMWYKLIHAVLSDLFQVGQGYPHDAPKVKCETQVCFPMLSSLHCISLIFWWGEGVTVLPNAHWRAGIFWCEISQMKIWNSASSVWGEGVIQEVGLIIVTLYCYFQWKMKGNWRRDNQLSLNLWNSMSLLILLFPFQQHFFVFFFLLIAHYLVSTPLEGHHTCITISVQ